MPADRVVTAKFHGGAMAGPPTFVVIHDAETPLADGYVASISEFFRKGPAAGTSAHHMVGPRSWLQLLPEDVVAYAAGPKANPRGIHYEQTGYASFTRAQWITTDGLAQVKRLGGAVRESCDRWKIPRRWCTDAQLRAAAAGQAGSGGLCTHAQVARVLGGTTHTDPEPNYPRDLLLDVVNGTAPTPPISEDGMATLTLYRNTRTGAVYLGGPGYWHPCDPLFVTTLQVNGETLNVQNCPSDAHTAFAQWLCLDVFTGKTSQRPATAGLVSAAPVPGFLSVPEELQEALQEYADTHPQPAVA